MLVRFWGTRGSLPVSTTANAAKDKIVAALLAANGRRFADAADAARFVDSELDFAVGGSFGGATSCVEIDSGDGGFLICDMGSALREFGLDSLARVRSGRSKIYNIFLSHMHWDHIMGFPFFGPAYDPMAEINVFGGHDEMEVALRRQQEFISFPVPFERLQARIRFRTLEPGTEYDIGGCSVSVLKQHHPNDSYGYRFERNGKAVVYSTDSEHKAENSESEHEFVSFFRNADLVIVDTMYSLADAISIKQDWGHSSNIVAVDLCRRAGARRMAMFHHEPVHDDRTLETLHHETARYEELMRRGSPIEILCAYDRLEVPI